MGLRVGLNVGLSVIGYRMGLRLGFVKVGVVEGVSVEWLVELDEVGVCVGDRNTDGAWVIELFVGEFVGASVVVGVGLDVELWLCVEVGF